METQKIWNKFNDELYFFILKKTKNREHTNDIFQNTFLKIHENVSKLKEEEKARAWIFQIARNEIANYYTKEAIYVAQLTPNINESSEEYQPICCFDNFINDLPEIYKQVIALIYIKGQKQKDIATQLDISLENVKARVKRAKDILKNKLNTCCKYEFDKKGKLTGASNCAVCKAS
ncbi:RNA polymerase, sigma subunit, SigZ [Cellulophaga algicola DSM 14237]|uniref:RNA polymerase, sigma subunit, SigZ n=1 Tax=Cellulophaga algicola (strain DSM 14237 / IC166 / ACAM 630) TaxID=688270 RepID=E6X4Z3_CELAD|nr:sigma-70 family RNA polymerase sigma factor [Cellulophaga algicola]ADV50485.1 RNA polymerase, sigma subunit, SigZ [Cellulophaga algicola DSM 14237]